MKKSRKQLEALATKQGVTLAIDLGARANSYDHSPNQIAATYPKGKVDHDDLHYRDVYWFPYEEDTYEIYGEVYEFIASLEDCNRLTCEICEENS